MELTLLAKKYKSDKADLGNEYTSIYEEYFGGLKESNVNILEIGLALYREYVKEGKINPNCDTSLKIWRDYFKKGMIVGFDNKDFSFLNNERIKTFRGDQGSRTSLLEFSSKFDFEFDIIIDDGSHISNHQQVTFDVLFMKLKKGGFYFIEDLYIRFKRDEFPTGFSTRELFKRWSEDEWVNPNDFFKNLDYIKRNIDYIKFFNKERLVLIKKLD